MNLASSKRQWPLGRGFERYYGFLGGETNQWYPDLVYDNHPVEQPSLPEDGYHLPIDLTDKAIEFIRDAKTIAPDKPFFLYYCPGAAHAPHHVPKEWIDKYKGKFDMGYEAYRERVLERQKQMGLLPEGAELSPINPYADDDQPRRQAVVRARHACDRGTRSRPTSSGCSRAWPRCTRASSATPTTRSADCSTTSRTPASSTTRSSCSSPTTARRARADPTARSTRTSSSTASRTTIEENLKLPRRAGQPEDLQPLPDGLGVGVQHAVQDVEALHQLRGRHRRPADRRLAEGHQGRRARSGTSTRHAIDIVPTLLRVPRHRAARRGQRLHAAPDRGRQLRGHASTTPTPTTDKETQFYSMLGTRAIWHEGWKAATAVPAAPESWGDFNQQRWELFDTENDPSECHDLAEQPEGCRSSSRCGGPRPGATRRCRSSRAARWTSC